MYTTRRLLSSLCLLFVLTLVTVGQLSAVDVPERSHVGEKQVRHPDLDIELVLRETSKLPPQAQERAMADLAALGAPAEHGRVDARGGRWGTITLSSPLVPGKGIGNALQWEGLGFSPPADDTALAAAAGSAFRGYLERNAAALRVDPSELAGNGRVTPHQEGTVIQIHLPRVVNGVPVRDSYLTAVINHGNLVLFGAHQWGDIDVSTVPEISQEAALAAAQAHVDPFTIDGAWGKSEFVLVPLAGRENLKRSARVSYTHRLAWVVRPSFEDDLGRYEALVDAHTGELLSFEDTNQYAEVKGGVYPVTNDGIPPDGVEQLGWPMPFQDTTLGTTDTGGNVTGSGSITATFFGPFVDIFDNCGADSLTQNDNIDWGTSGGTDCVTPGFGGAGNTHASRTGFYELNKMIEMARGQLPANPWLQQRLRSNMNINNTCNAFWNGTVNFYRSGGGCANTGEIAGVFDHEWGHGMDANDAVPGIASPSGEGIADIYTALRLNDSCIGRNFRTTVCTGNGDPCLTCTGVRDIDYLKRQSGNPHDYSWSNANCGGSVHCVGGVYSEAVWSLWKRKLQSAPYNYDNNTAWEIVNRLTFIGAGNTGTWFSGGPPNGGCGAGSGYMNYLAADDDNGNLNDGTPHMTAIWESFNDQEIACGTPTVQDSGCAGTPTTAPVVTATPSDKSVSLSWGAVAGATSYEVFRTEGVFACDFGKVKLGATTGTNWNDTGLQNGRDYSYVVIPKGPSAACFGPASSCATAAPAAGPNLAVNASSAVPAITSGDGDEFLDNCEQGALTFDVNNTGLGALTNVRIVGVTPTSHPATTVTTSFPAAVSPSTLAEGATGSGGFSFTAGGLAPGDTLSFQVEVTADELTASRFADLTVLSTETDLAFTPSVTYSFESDTEDWTTIQGTFNRSSAGGGGGGTAWYEQSSANLDNQCDQIQSPVMVLSPTSTLTLSNQFDIEPQYTNGVWYDRANVGVVDVATGNRTLVTPDDGRLYSASGPQGTCGTGGQGGWADTAATWASSSWSASALGSAGFAGQAVQLDVRYGTDSIINGSGFRFDEVTVTDVSFQGTDGQSDVCVLAPEQVTLTLSVTDGFTPTPVLPGDTVRDPSLTTLVMEWAPSSSGSGIASYEAAWSQEATLPAPGAMTSYVPGDQLVHEQTAHEASAWFAHLVIVDDVGNRTEQSAGPIYIDAPTTPDYINPDDGLTPTVYRGWMESGCSQIGTSQEALVEQKMYLTWDAANLRIAWAGADWATDGDLYIYLDTGAGGATEAYNPHGSTGPIALPDEGAGQLGADYLVYVEDADTARLLRWDGSAWILDRTLASPNFLFGDGITDLYLPLSWIGSPTQLKLAAVASEESALRLWAGMPGPNPLNSEPVVNSVAVPYLDTPFRLTQNYDWANVGGSGVCPSAGQFENSDPAATITSTPDGLEAGFLEHDLPGLTIPGSRLDANSDGVVDLNQDGDPSNDMPLSGNATPLLPGSTVDYTLRVTNDGAGDATGVQVVLAAYGAMSLSAGTNSVNNLGTIPSGAFVEFSFSADVGSTSHGGEVTAVVSDNVHGEFDWLWVVHSVDYPPVANNDSYSTNEDTALVEATVGPLGDGVLANDSDADSDPLTAVLDTTTTNGLLVLNSDGSFTYTPDPNFCGPDSFTYHADDGQADSNIATVDIDVICVDDAPVASDNTATVAEDDPATTIDVLTNDNDVDGGPKSIDSVTQPANGTVVNNGTDLTYGPDANYCNDGSPTDDFTYTLTPGGSTATVRVTVTCVNDAPLVAVDQASVTVNEGQTASNTGTVSDVDGNTVTLTASVGTVVNHGDGTWSWSFVTSDGPAQSQTVTITANDGSSDPVPTTFELQVENLPPTLSNVAITNVNENGVATLSGNIADVGTQDSFGLDVDWGDGSAVSTYTYPAGTTSFSVTHQYLDDNPSGTASDPYIVSLTLTDDDTGSDTDSTTVTVTNLNPVVTGDFATQTVQYSDRITDITITAVDVEGDPLQASTSWNVDTGSFVSGLPSGLSLTTNSCSVSGNGRTCTWTVSGIADVSAGTYVIRVTITDDDLGQTSIDRTIVVAPEDATVAFDGSNPVSERVDTPGGDSGVFSLAVAVTETEPDQPAGTSEAGEIRLAVVEMTLVPVGPGGSVVGTCTNGAVTGSGGYDSELPVSCTFDNVPVNTYTVDVTVVGGYYTGSGEDVLVVYDPSLGFTTGGGWFYWPETNDRTNFGYTMRYNRRGTNIQGSLLLIRHLADGSIYRLKSNALEGLSIGESADSTESFGWASVTGKSTYLEPGWEEPIGNQDFVFYVEDRNEPGTGTDRFWIEAVGELMMSPPATENAVEISGGNIVAPHTNASDLPPGVSIADPTDGSTVSGEIVITVEATDDDDVTQVEFFVDGSSLSVDTDGSDGWFAPWDTGTESDGDHVVSATATDTGGQTASDSVTVTVDNVADLPLHVGDLDGSTTSARGGKWNATVNIKVADEFHGPLQNATVSGSWSAGASGSASCVTDVSGLCSITRSNIGKSSTSATFNVDSVLLGGYTYDSGSNHDPDEDSDGASIVVLQP